MLRNIRYGVWETNSSSSHSIVMTNNSHVSSVEEGRFYIYKGELIVGNDTALEFGRSPFEMLTRPHEKLRYLLASAADDTALRKKIETEILALIPGAKRIKYPTCWDSKKKFYGSIDHQSYGLLFEFLEKHNVSYIDFLFMDKYVVVIDGDEYEEWEKLKDAGLLDEGNIVDELGIYGWKGEKRDD